MWREFRPVAPRGNQRKSNNNKKQQQKKAPYNTIQVAARATPAGPEQAMITMQPSANRDSGSATKPSLVHVASTQAAGSNIATTATVLADFCPSG
jgi:hypothetical protein